MDAVKLLPVHPPTLTSQQDMQLPVAEPATFSGQLNQMIAQICIIVTSQLIVIDPRGNAD